MKITLTFDSWEDFETFCSDNRKDGGLISVTVKEKSKKDPAEVMPEPIVRQEEVSVPDPVPAVPTDEKTFVLDDLSKAAMTLMQSGKQADLSKLLSGYGVQSLRDLTPDQYGLFATGLRTLGAPI